MEASGPATRYRRSFVGREAEFGLLQNAFVTAATSGSGSLVMLVGEPGIGKTALCEQLAVYARQNGGLALIGRCYEGSHSQPYLPFIEALRAYSLECPPAELREQLGSGAAEIAGILQELADRIEITALPAASPEDSHWRLLQAVTAFLANVSRRQPLLLVLEDLHDADQGTLDLLVFLSRRLTSERIVVLGTYRDVDVDRTQPLSSTLAELRRAGAFLRVALRGLPVAAVTEMVAGVVGEEASRRLGAAIYSQTEGNPLFVQEIVRDVAEKGADQTADDLSGLPEGLRDVIGKRLARLSAVTNQTLSIASVCGREFRLDVLRTLTGLVEEELFAQLEEASDHAIIEQRPGVGPLSFRFTHALVRQTVYEAIFAPRRVRLHQQAALALEEVYALRLPEHAAEIAAHFTQSTDAAALEKALLYWELAADHAFSVRAFGEAVLLLEQAIEVQDASDRYDRNKRFDLLKSLGRALLLAGQGMRATNEIAPKALALAESLGDEEKTLDAAEFACQALFWSAGLSAGMHPSAGAWLERLDSLAKDGTRQRIAADHWLAAYTWLAGETARAWQLQCRALEAARGLKDDYLIAEPLVSILTGLASPPEAADERIALVHDLAWPLSLRATSGALQSSMAIVFISVGDREASDLCVQRMQEVADSAPSAKNALAPITARALQRTLDGDFLGALAMRDAVGAVAVEVGREVFARFATTSLALRPLIYIGRAAEAIDSLPLMPRIFAAGGYIAGARTLCLAHAGRKDEARALLTRIAAERDLGKVESGHTSTLLCLLLEAATILEDRAAAEAILPRLAATSHLIHSASYSVECAGRIAGDAFLFLGRLPEAELAYSQGLAVCDGAGFRPEAALCRLGLVAVGLAQKGDAATATRVLDAVRREFEAMSMPWALDRVQRLQEKASGATPRAAYAAGLSEREVEVLVLMAQGRSNQEIGEALFISQNTVARHVSNIFVKTGAGNRTEAANFAHRNGLV